MLKLQYECPFTGDTNEDLSAGKVLMTSSRQVSPKSGTRPQLLKAVLGVNLGCICAQLWDRKIN